MRLLNTCNILLLFSSMRVETQWKSHGDLACDEYEKDINYTNYRSRGGGDWLLIYTVAGHGSILSTEGDELRVGPGDCVAWAPGEPQEYNTAPGTDSSQGHWHILWAHFLPRPEWQPWLRWPLHGDFIRHVHLPPGQTREGHEAALRRMLATYRASFPGSQLLAINALEEALLWVQAALTGHGWATLDSRVRRAMDYLAQNPRRAFDLGELALHSGLSVSRLAHLFKRETGTTPQRYQERLRLRQARQLLRLTNLGIAEIAAELGYQDAFYFTNRFRKAEGVSPSEYRRNATTP